jgi:four helix bundle protein
MPAPLPIEERAFEFAVAITKFCDDYDDYRRIARRNALGQLVRAGTSIGANVEEAQGAHSRADFLSKMTIALKEARETRYWLRLLLKSGLVESIAAKDGENPRERCDALLEEANEIRNILGASVRTLRKKRDQES